MRLREQITSLALILLISSRCAGQSQSAKEGKSFPKQQNITESLLIDCSENAPNYIKMYNDSILMLVNSMPTGKIRYHFSLYGVAKGNLLSQRMEFGRQFGQAMGFVSSGILKNGTIWANDINRKAVVFSGFKNISDTGNIKMEKSLSSDIYRSLVVINDSTAIGSGNYNSDFKIDFLNLTADGKVERGIIPYGTDPAKPVSTFDKSIQENFLLLKPTQDQSVLAYRYTDKIEIVDLKTGKSITVQGPDGFEPNMDKVKGPDGREMGIRNNKTKIAFLSGAATNNFIYLLFSGKESTAKDFFFGKSIYVYSWDGKPVKKINLSQDIQAFAVSSNDKVIYTFDAVKKQIRSGKLD